MLKHVSNICDHLDHCKFDDSMAIEDTVSLNSSASSNSNGSLNESTDSSTSSFSSSSVSSQRSSSSSYHNDIITKKSWNQSASSLQSIGSSTSSSLSSPSKAVIIKIYTRILCTDVEYKTLSIDNKTTCKEIVQMILKKFRLQHRDSNLFYLTLEAWIKQTGIPIRSVMTLEDDACPALLQSCYRQKDLKFTLLMRSGQNIRIFNTCLQGPMSLNVLISERTNVDELIKLVCSMLSLPEHHSRYELFEFSPSCRAERKIQPQELPTAIQHDWPSHDYKIFQLRYCVKVPTLLNTTVDNFKKNLKTEFRMNLFAPQLKSSTTSSSSTSPPSTFSALPLLTKPIIPNTNGNILYI
ncbi:hypothetical protein SSS_01138 [Sarcoptes scabiei]|nr:hypothetical protein SSS_01138 [Sarcoptes scabiei]